MERALAVFVHDRKCAEKARADAEWERLRVASELPACPPLTVQAQALVRALRRDATRVWKSASADDLTTAVSGSSPPSTHSAHAPLVSSRVVTDTAAVASLPAPIDVVSVPADDGGARVASSAASALVAAPDGDSSVRVAAHPTEGAVRTTDIWSESLARESPPPQSSSTAIDSSCLATVDPSAATDSEDSAGVVRAPVAVRIFPLTSSSSLDDLAAELGAAAAWSAASALAPLPEHSAGERESVDAALRDDHHHHHHHQHCHSFSRPTPPAPPLPPTTRDGELRSDAIRRRFHASVGLEVPPPLTPSLSRYLVPAGPGPLPRTLAAAPPPPPRSVFTFESCTTFPGSTASASATSLAPIREHPVASDADRNREHKTRDETKSGEIGSQSGDGGGDPGSGDRKVPVIGAPRKSRRLLLHTAACSGNISTVNELLVHGHDVDARNQDGSTPLMWACRRGHWAVCHLLLAHDADASSRNSTGSTALHYAARCPVRSLSASRATQRIDAVDEKRQHASDAATADFVKRQRRVMRALVVAGAPVNWADEHGRTALHDAVMRDAATLVDMLLAARADPDSPDRDNATPLHLACATDRAHTLTNVVQLLDCRRRRATVDLQDRHGRTPLHYAFACGADSVAAKLVSVGADVRDADSFVTSRDRVRQQALLAFAAVSVRAMLRAKRGRVRRLDDRLADECFGVRATPGASVTDSGSSLPSPPPPPSGPAPPQLCRANLRWWSRHKRHHCYVCGYAFCSNCVQGTRADQMICATCDSLKAAADADRLSQSSPPSPRSRRHSDSRSGRPNRRGSLSSGVGVGVGVAGDGVQQKVDDGRVSSSESSDDEGDGGDSDLEDSIDWGNGGEHHAGKIDGSASDGGGRRRRPRRAPIRDDDDDDDDNTLRSDTSVPRGDVVYSYAGGGDSDLRRGARPIWPVFEMPKNATAAIASVAAAATTTAAATDTDAYEEKRSARVDTDGTLGRSTLERSSSVSDTRPKADGALRLPVTVRGREDRTLDFATQ